MLDIEGLYWVGILLRELVLSWVGLDSWLLFISLNLPLNSFTR